MSKNVEHIVLYSGGISSFCTALLLKELGQNPLLVFCDTKTEDEDLYRFLNETVEHLGCEMQWLEDGRDVWEVFTDVKYMGNNRIDPCSRILKRDLFKKWLANNYKPDECILHYGINADESHRIDRLKERWLPYTAKSPLCDIRPVWTAKTMNEKLKETGIKRPRLYDYGFPHNNCGGFCVKSGQAQFKNLYKHFPERYMEHELRQEKLFEKIGPRGFIRKTVGGVLRYLSLREFRLEFLEVDGDVDPYDFGGCECFA